MSRLFREVSSHDFLSKHSCTATAESLFNGLLSSDLVVEMELAHRAQVFGQPEIAKLLNDLFSHFKVGERFQFDISVAATLVALRSSHADFVSPLIEKFAATTRRETPMCSRIAKMILKDRESSAVAKTYVKEKHFENFDFQSGVRIAWGAVPEKLVLETRYDVDLYDLTKQQGVHSEVKLCQS